MAIRFLLFAASALLLTACSREQEAAGEMPDMNPQVAGVDTNCDRSCLMGIAHLYIDALGENDPTSAPLADDVAFVENVTRLDPGEGLWETTLEGPQDFVVMVPDEELQQVGMIVAMTRINEGQSQPVIVGMRIKMNESGLITEAEHLVSGIRPEMLERLQTPRAGLTAEISEASRMSHEDLASLGMSYYDALDENDGSLMPFADDCQRHENGMITAGPGEPGPGPFTDPDSDQAPVARDCAGQLNSLTFTYIDVIDNRRLVAVDPVTGLVMGFSHFRHPMDNLPYDVIHIDGTTSERTAESMPFAPFDLPAAHIFKVGADGLVHEIEAMGFTTDLYSPTGWE